MKQIGTLKLVRAARFGIAGLGCALLTASPLAAHAQKHRSISSTWDVEAHEYLGNATSEEAVSRGLAYLAAHQQPDGHWASGNYSADVGITGMVVMAFLASGHQPGRGKYGLCLNEATDFLANQVRMDGQFGSVPGLVRSPPGGGASPMYGHGFGTLALAELYGMTRRRDIKPKLEAAIKLIEDTQNQSGDMNRDGGWRYKPEQGDADLSCTVPQILALRAARDAGIRVSSTTLDRAVAYVKRSSNPKDGGFLYQIGQQDSAVPRSAAGALTLLMARLRDTPQARGGLNYLTKHPFTRNLENYRDYPFYALYYSTQTSYQAGGDYWRLFYPPVRDWLTTAQDKDGSWGKNGSEAGTEYATAMSVLVLQVPAGLLPIYQK